MFVQLEEGPPNIVRLFGKGRVFERGTAEYGKRTEGLDLHVRVDYAYSTRTCCRRRSFRAAAG